MDKSTLYLQNSEQAQADFKYAVEKFFNLITFKNECTVLDIGCGPGNITCDGLFPLLPKDVKLLVGVDILDEFLNYAKLHYQKDPRIRYQYLDITDDNIPKDFYFDNIFSFYCLHFIKDQRSAIKNMYKMLKPGGDIFVNFMGYWTILDIHTVMAREEKWKNFLTQDKIAQTHTAQQPEKYLTELLEETGFTVRISTKVEKTWRYPKKIFMDIIMAVVGYNIPSNMVSEFIDDVLKIMENRNLLHVDDLNEIFLCCPYTLLTAVARK